MTPEQIAYVARRRSQIRYWPWLALILVGLLAAGYGWLWLHAPININPFLVLDQFSQKTVSDEEMIMLAARGSLALVTCGLFLLLIIFLISVALLNELRLIRLLDQAMAGSAAPAATSAAGAAGAEAPEAGSGAEQAGAHPGEVPAAAESSPGGEPPVRNG